MKNLFFILFLLSANIFAQDISYNKKIVDTLTSPFFWGRGYTNNGMQKAAIYIVNEFKTAGLKPLNKKSYFQRFSYSANTFPGKMEVILNDKKLLTAIDYIIAPGSQSAKKSVQLNKLDSVTYVDENSEIIISLKKKLTWSAEQMQQKNTIIELDKNLFTETPKNIKVNIEAKFIKKFETSNIAAMVVGTQVPDSFIFITAHYDHLGGMGSQTYFPGANDNASGVALLLSLAKYYAAHPQKYSIAFLLFAGEEIGLLGSKYYTEHPIVPLNKIRFLTNTDLAGTGIDGITIVNATIFTKEFALINIINDEEKLITKINARGKAANSDHYWFTEKAVPSFFFYTLGGITAYHDVYDVAATLPLNEQADLQKLIIKFNEALQN
ncbi:MAG: M28 family peptidase [Ferruginibacter sp.]|nr:M28 family peptidase [Ferruginibacter sp.]